MEKLALGKVHHNLEALIAETKNKKKCTSLAVFKQSKNTGFKVEEVDRE